MDPEKREGREVKTLPVPLPTKLVRSYQRNKMTQHAGRLLLFRVKVQGMSSNEAWDEKRCACARAT